MSPPSSSALRLADLTPGDQWLTPARTVAQCDINAFAGLSGDFNPLHMDALTARGGPFGGIVAHGLLGLALTSGLVSHAPRVETLALLSVLEWRFLEPIRPGDTLHVESRVESIEERARGRRGVVTWHRRLINQDGKVVQEGRIQTLVQGSSSTT